MVAVELVWLKHRLGLDSLSLESQTDLEATGLVLELCNPEKTDCYDSLSS